MKANAIPLLLSCVIAFGCARMGTRQGDKSTTTTVYALNEKGRTNSITITETRETQTRASGTAVISSSSSFEGLDASQDGKKQGLKVKKANQQSDVDRMFDVMGGLLRMYGASQGIQLGNPQAVPSGYKVVPKDDPSKPHPEVE